MKNDNEGNYWLPEINIPFPVVTEEDELLPEYSFRDITLNVPFKVMGDMVFVHLSVRWELLQQIHMIMMNYIP